MSTLLSSLIRGLIGLVALLFGAIFMLHAFAFFAWGVFTVFRAINLSHLSVHVPGAGEGGAGLATAALFLWAFWLISGAALIWLGLRFTGLLQRRSTMGRPESVVSVEDRLDELERLKRRALVTPEEYAAKRQEILNDL